MRRIGLAVVLSLAVAPLAAEAQPQSGKVWRVGYLAVSSAELDNSLRAAFQRELRDLGYVEGQNVVIEWRHADGRFERVPQLAAELVRLNVDVIVTYGGTRVVKEATSTIPIVMAVSADPVGEGLVASLARPGGNVTGLADTHADLAPKRLEFLKQLVPAASRVAILFNPASDTALQLKNVQSAASALGVTGLPFDARGPEDLDRAFVLMRRGRAEALLLIPEPAVITFRSRIPELAVKHRLPAIGTVRAFAEHGLLMSYGTSFLDLWRRAATYVDKILKGAKPADLPVEQPTKFELVINLKTAKALGLTIPQTLLLRADQLIQ